MSDNRVYKVTVDEVWDYLNDGDWHTNKELCEQFDVAPKTIKKKIVILQTVGNCILFGNDGYKLIDDTSIDEDVAIAWKRNAIWVKGTLLSQARISKTMNTKSIVSALRKALPSVPEERRGLRQSAVALQRVIDASEIEFDD